MLGIGTPMLGNGEGDDNKTQDKTKDNPFCSPNYVDTRCCSGDYCRDDSDEN